MRTPNLYTDSRADPFAAVPVALRSGEVELIYATDRVAESPRGGGLRYGYARSRELTIGRCRVAVGASLTWDELITQSRRRDRTRAVPVRLTYAGEVERYPQFDVPPRRVHGRWVEDPNLLAASAAARDALHALLAERLALTPRKVAYVYIHGFNNQFHEAASVMAELWHFLGREGVPIVYSWPAGSGLSLVAYNYDRESGEFTVFHLKRFLRDLAACPDLEEIHIIAHSRGTDVLTAALRELHAGHGGNYEATRAALKLGHVVLAAPDIDFEVSTQRITAERLGLVPRRLTIYLCGDDRALWFARLIFFSFQRLGLLRPEDLKPAQIRALQRMPELSLIDARVTTDWVGHAYFYSNPAVSSDLILLLREDCEPGVERRPLTRQRNGFWVIEDGYPSRGGKP